MGAPMVLPPEDDPLMSTLEVPRKTHASAMRAWPLLTVLAHPDHSRVGDVVWLALGRTEISRLTPEFEPPEGGDRRALQDRFISRQPIILSVGDDGAVRLDPGTGRIELVADGRHVDRAERLDAGTLARGVVLELSDRVTLYLQTVTRDHAAWSESLGLVGHSPSMEAVRRQILQVADLDVPVLIRGESGVGKELVARAVHAASGRVDGPYEAVNMAAVPSTLAASELFGHEKGAFSGADRGRAGYFERADGGTLFLDEIGDTPPDVQAMLLRVLETGDVQRVGAERTRSVSVRVLAATDADLERATRTGEFRTPLFHRLAGYQIHVAPLRERRDDIGRLFHHFVRDELTALGAAHRLDRHRETPWVPAALVARLARYDWGGNVRQLRNVTRQLVIANRDADEMSWQRHVQKLLPPTSARPERASVRVPAHAKPPRPVYRKPSDVAEDEVVEAMREHGWRLAPAAKALNISRTTLYALVEESTLVRKASDLSAAEIRAAVDLAGGLTGAALQLEVSTHALKIRMSALGM